MKEEQKVQILEMLEKIENKNFGFYFFTLDTKGNPVASVAYIYDTVKALTELGYSATILHEKNDYHGVESWLGKEFMELPHESIENQTLNLTTLDYIIVPEIFSNVMDQVKAFPCKKIVLSQSYAYILELLGPGLRWDIDYGFKDVITTSNTQADFIKEMFRSVTTYVIPPSVPEYFKPTDKVKKPIIGIMTRDNSDTLRIIKSFYLQHPLYKWVTFRDLRGLPKETFAKELSEACLAVWVDNVAGFGTFPVEAMECNTPVIGKIPDMVPEWMATVNKTGQVDLIDNGVWTNNILSIPTLISQYMQVWLEDTVPTQLTDGMENSKGKYTTEIQKNKIKEVYETLISNRKNEFEALLKEEKKLENHE
jgi:hypothetical protein